MVVVNKVAQNLQSFVEVCLPKFPSNSRHSAVREWAAENPHVS
jgi:hypothetical protein